MSNLRIAVSNFVKIFSMYIEYYFKNFSSFSLHYSIILRNIFSQSVCFLKLSTSIFLLFFQIISSSLPYFHLYIFQCALLKILNFVLLCQISSQFVRYTNVLSHKFFLIFLALLVFNFQYYWYKKSAGGAEESRTPDLLLARQAL